MTLGSFPDWSAKQAREEAKAKKRLVDQGGDPMRDRHQERAAPTMADLAGHYTLVHLPRKRPGSQENDRQLLAKHILPRLGNRKLAAIRHTDIASLHRHVSETAPIAANRVVALLSTMLNLAIREEWVDVNVAKGIDRNPEERRERFLSPAEIARLVEALAAHPERTSADAVLMLLLTGARRGEVLGATWTEFDLDAGVWIKPSAHTKQKRSHRVPLSEGALDLLRATKAAQAAEVEAAKKRGVIRPMPRLVFPGAAGQPMHSVKTLWRSVCKSADIKDVRLHDLRHTYASILVSNGLSLPIIGRMLGHTQSQTTARYAHLADDPLREAANIAGKAIAGAKASNVVVPLPKAKFK
jgi:integrase